jgi:hypothetical protein
MIQLWHEYFDDKLHIISKQMFWLNSPQIMHFWKFQQISNTVNKIITIFIVFMLSLWLDGSHLVLLLLYKALKSIVSCENFGVGEGIRRYMFWAYQHGIAYKKLFFSVLTKCRSNPSVKLNFFIILTNLHKG